MQDKDRTKEQLILEVTGLRQRVADLEAMDTERRQAEQKFQSHMRRQAALLQLSHDLTTSLDEAEICRTVVRGLHDKLGYDYMSLFLVDPASGDRVLRASVGWPEIPSGWRLAAGQGLSEQPFLDGQLHYTPDVTREPRYVPGIDGRSEVDVPLRVDERILGVLVVESTHRDAFDQDDFAMLTAAANQTAVALERAREHQAVKEAEIRYQSLFDRVPVELYRTTPAGRFLDVNPAMARMLGHPDRESLLAVNASDLYVDAGDRRRWQAELERQELVRDFETQIRRYDGSTIMARDSARAIRDAQGQVLYYEGSLEDITERKRAEEALQRSEEEVRWWAEALEALQATVLDITIPHDLPTLLETIVERAARLLNAPCGGLYLCDPDKEQVRCVVSHNTPSDYRDVVLQYGEGAAGTVAQTGKPLIIDDYSTWHGRASAYEAEQPFKAVLAVPLIWQGQVTGVVDIVGYAEGELFTQADLELLTLFANHAAIAVENTRLYEQAQQEIAERKQLEQQIEERRLYLERVLACAPDAIVTMDAQHRILGWNQGAERLFGYPPEEVIGRDLDEIVAAPDTGTSEEMIRFTREALAGLPVPPIETIRYRRDGTPVDVILAGAPILVEDTLVGIVAIYTDITERKRAEEALRESEELYRTLVQTSPDAVTATDLQGTITYASPRTLELHGFEREEELLGKNATELVAPQDRQIAVANMERTLREGSVRNAEYTLVKNDGTPFAGGLDAALITDAHGNPRGFIATTRDITERKRAEEEVRRLKEFNEGIVQNMAEGIAMQDAEGYLTFVNPAAATLLGYTPEELIGQYWTLIVPPDQQPTIQAADERHAQGQADRYEVEMLRQDGKRVPVLISGSPSFDADTGCFAGTLAVFTDISERRQAEEKLARRAQEMAALYETSLEINAQPDLPTLLYAIVRRAAGLLGARMGGLALLQPDNLLELMISHNLPGDHVGTRLRLGEGLSGRVAQSGEPMMVPNYQAWEGRTAILSADPFRRMLGVPLKLRDQVIGVINITDDEQTGPFDEDEIRLVSLFADQAAIAIENARLLEAEARRRREAETLQAATQALTATLDLQQVFELILRELRQVVPYDSASVQQLKGQRLEIIGGHGFPNLEELLGVSFDLQAQDNPNRQVIHSRQPFILEDAPAKYAGFKRQPHAPAGIRSWLGVPLLFGDRLIGMIALDKREPGFYTEDHARLAMAFAAQAAIAIENARLFQAQREQRDLAEALREAARVMGTSLELGEILRLILDQLKRVLVYDAASVLILQEDNVPDVVIGVGYADEALTHREASQLLRDSPIMRRMARDLQPMVSADVRQLDDWIWVPGAEQVRSWLGIPLVAHGRMIGALMVDHSQPGYYGEAEMQTALALSQHAAQAIENARLFQAEREQRELAEALRQATAAISSSLDLDQVLDQILEQVSRVIPGDTTNVMLIESGHARIVRWRSHARFGQEIPAVVLRVADTPSLRHMQETGETMIISDTATEPDWVHLPEVAWIRSYIGAPIRVRDQVIGFLNVDSATPGFFKRANADQVRAFADQASLALENARFFEETSRRAEQMATLNRIGLAITSDLNLEEVLNTLYEQIKHILDAGAFYVALYDEETELIHFPLLTGVNGPCYLEPLHIDRNPGLTGHVIRSGKPLYIPDTQNLPEEVPYGPICLIDMSTRSYIGVPMIFRERVMGVLSIQSYEPDAYTDADVALLMTIATQATIAIENARLYNEARRRNQELALLNRVIAASAVSNDVEVILETVCQELALALDVPQSAAALLNANRTEAVVVAEYLAEGRPPALGEIIPVEGNPSFQYLLEQKKPLVVEDAQSDPRLAPIHELERRRGTISLLILPLVVEGELVGSLGVDAIEPRSFTAEEVDLVWRVANQVSSALARARLDETQRRLSAAVEQAADIVVITGTDGTILYVNPAFERVTGFSRAEVTGQEPQILRGSAVVGAFHQKLWQTLQTGEVWQERMNNVRQDGTAYTLDLTVSPVRNQAGEIINYVGTMRDVTREVQLERQFQQSQKMEALGRLAGGIAHDFNNLLTVIHLSIRLLDRHLRPEDPLWEHVRRIEETGERAAKLTKQLLSFSRREIIEPRVLDLNEVVRDLNRMLQRIIGEDIELVTNLAEDLWSLKMDPSQVEQVIMNLVVNARDAMPSGGTLTIETGNATLDEAYAASQVDVRAGEYVLLTIHDTGMGMDDDVKAHLFEPFFTTKERGQGTGLGLPTVFGIAKQNEGHAEVHSDVGHGTTFRIYLPRIVDTEAPSEATMRARSPDLLQGTETVLVVEDEPTVRRLAARVLTSCGYQVLAASDGPQALEIGEQHKGPIHLLLTDVVLPRMSGKELADRLQKQRPEMQVLFASGYTDDAITHHGVLAPGTAFLAKPFTVEDLTYKVRSVLDSPA